MRTTQYNIDFYSSNIKHYKCIFVTCHKMFIIGWKKVLFLLEAVLSKNLSLKVHRLLLLLDFN